MAKSFSTNNLFQILLKDAVQERMDEDTVYLLNCVSALIDVDIVDELSKHIPLTDTVVENTDVEDLLNE